MNGLFVQLEDEEFFVGFVGDLLRSAPKEISSVMHCTHTIDESRLRYAAAEYKQNIEKFAVLLYSSNPDHYKRAGALLHALNQSGIVSDIQLEYPSDELEAGYTRVNSGDAKHILTFVKFFEEFHNEYFAFDIAYRCCAAYEDEPTIYDFDYLHNVCHYLKSNTNLSVESFFMLFKSLMH